MPLPPFVDGQVWQMGDSTLRIGLVGKTLVHYKHYSDVVKRPHVQLSGKGALERFLQKHAAILLPDAPPPVAAKPARSGGKSLSSGAGKRTPAAKPQPARAD